MCCTLLLIVLAILVPPVPVIYLQGFYSKDFLLNVLLLMLGYVPAVIHAIYLIFHSAHGEKHNYRDLEAQECQSHDGIYQQGWSDRGRLETDLRTTNGGESTTSKQAPPPYTIE